MAFGGWGGLLVALLAAVALAVLLARVHLWFWVRRLSTSPEYALVEEVACPDGSAFELRHVPPTASPAADLPPVLLVHGLFANHRNHDLHPDYSLARYLAAAGRDVWLLTLRSGRGRTRRRERALLTFEAMARHDVPLAVDEVRRRTGGAVVDVVGFSMGGMLIYASLGRFLREEAVRRVVVVGSPSGVAHVPLLRLLARLPRALVPRLRFRLGARLFAFAAERVSSPFHRLIANAANLPPGLGRSAMVDVIEDIPGALAADFLGWAARDGVVTVAGQPVLEGLPRLRTPVLFVAGSRDHLAPLSSVRAAYERWGRDRPAVDKCLLVPAEGEGASGYGHGDLAVGRNVKEQVFRPIAAFLAEPVTPAA
jgi:polyhydroxyalkanoate synthase subunit PhaC